MLSSVDGFCKIILMHLLMTFCNLLLPVRGAWATWARHGVLFVWVFALEVER